MNTQIRKELGINVSINVRGNKSSSTVLHKSIEDFFLSVCPETKKVEKNPQTIQMKKRLFAITYHHYACCISLLQRVRMIAVIPTSVNIVHIM